MSRENEALRDRKNVANHPGTSSDDIRLSTTASLISVVRVFGLVTEFFGSCQMLEVSLDVGGLSAPQAANDLG